MSERQVGRPAKNYEDLHVQVPPHTKKTVETLAGVISQGEVVAAAVRVYIEQMRKG